MRSNDLISKSSLYFYSPSTDSLEIKPDMILLGLVHTSPCVLGMSLL